MPGTDESTTRRTYWLEEIQKAKKRFGGFWDMGERVVDEYRLQKADGSEGKSQDKYNILFSSTETIRPNLYAQPPKARVTLRHKDRANQSARDAVELLGNCVQYVMQEDDLDDVLDQVVEDLLLPGLAVAWVRYYPIFGEYSDDAGNKVVGEDGKPQEKLLDEQICFDYVYWKDFLTGVTRGWRTVPWIAKRVWTTKPQAIKQFGKEKANELAYSMNTGSSRDSDNTEDTAEIWEIWDKRSKTVFWFSESYADDVLDIRPDPLHLKNFFPCPRPMRAISNTRGFVPRALYTEYKSQAETLNTLTKRIRLLTEAIKVVGIFNGSEAKLSDMLSPLSGNKMIAVESWVSFAQTGGIKGNIEWMPLDAIVAALTQTLQAREICKGEIYEITGFSDIVRGVSKASETLGAQNLKANWAGARVKRMQKEVQRFARDLIAIAAEIIAEHCQPATIAMFGGIDIPDPQEVQANPDSQQIVQRFNGAIQVLRTEGKRCAAIDVETDSTILADEQEERKDRTDFLAAAGAFLQQAVPAMEATPELGPLLGAMLMFVVRTFPTSQPIEEEFDKVQKAMTNRPPKQPTPAEQADMQAKQSQAQTAQMQAQTAAMDAQTKQSESASKAQYEQGKLANDHAAEWNRHTEKMYELSLKERDYELQERALSIKEEELNIQLLTVGIQRTTQDLDKAVAAHEASMDMKEHELAADQQEHDQSMDKAGLQQQYDQMDQDKELAEQEPLTPQPAE